MDQVEMEPTSVELWILTDGSGSMEDGLPGGGGALIQPCKTHGRFI